LILCSRAESLGEREEIQHDGPRNMMKLGYEV
jgi:hypothetical protein